MPNRIPIHPLQSQISMQRMVVTKLEGNVLHRIFHLADQDEENSSVRREWDNSEGRLFEWLCNEVQEFLDLFSDLMENKQTLANKVCFSIMSS